MPQPAPFVEIYVYSPEVEGIHLRGGPIARGGLRWSDRQDYRTEVYGLMRAQLTKNAVIVPAGAKGGFYIKRRRRTRSSDHYVTFIRSLLSVTDNLVDGTVVRPERVRARDGDDTYLVVAADKGTATFSDTANRVSQEYGFWLDDAFASGGSAGYDHKALGITAKGAWESVKRHFKELGVDTQSRRVHRRRDRRHVRRRVRQRDAAERAHPARGRLRPPAHLHRPRPERRDRLRRAQAAVRARRARPGTTTTAS